MKKAHRTCVACRETTEADQLLRLVAHPILGAVVPDIKGNLPGRGAWIHVRRECLETVQKQPKLVHRALKTKVDCGDLLEHVETVLMKKI